MELLEIKLDEYRELRMELKYKLNTTIKLGFKWEEEKIKNDIAWVNQIIHLLEELKKS